MTSPASLVFDLDGTISDPAVGIARSLNYALQFYSYPAISEDQVSRFIGPPLDMTFQSITGNSSPVHVAALVSKYRVTTWCRRSGTFSIPVSIA